MIEELRRLAAAKPFEAFTIYLARDCKASVGAPEEICFTRLGVPKVRVEQDGKPIGWLLINVDYILGIRVSEASHRLAEPRVRTLQESPIANPELVEAARKFAEELREKEGDE